jgi:hypothetical protein
VPDPSTLPDAVFELDGEVAVPTDLARGPWSLDAQHGGAPAALLARALERADPGPADFVARLSVDLVRPVPLTPLEVRVRTTRAGKRVQWLEAAVTAEGVEVVRATAVRIRTADLALPVEAGETRPFAGPDESPVLEPDNGFDARFGGGPRPIFFIDAMELRQARGSWDEAGAATMWFRLRVPVVAGEEPSPLQRVAAAADFGNGVSAALERGRYLFINPDLTITLHRPPEGEWVALDAVTHAEPNGVGLAESALFDVRGRIGRSLQTLLVDRL